MAPAAARAGEVAGELPTIRPLAHILAVRLDASTIAQLGDIGRKKGVGASTLARMWLLERLEREKGR